MLGNIFTVFLFAQQLPITPYPNQVEIKEGSLKISQTITIDDVKSSFKGELDVFKKQLNDYTNYKIKKRKLNTILYLIKDESVKQESYELKISSKGIEMKAGDSVGAFYGLQSVLQILIDSEIKEQAIAYCQIKDQPRYAWRGLMLDESRYFFGGKEVKRLLDMMAIHKLNKFHWHLTDSPGWRMEIKKYPLLTKVGGMGNQFDPNAPAQYYSQKEIKEIIEYAAQRHIEVIPEIDMPGHATAAVRAYPEISGGGSEKYPNFTFHPGKEETFEFLTNVLKEVGELFPSKYIHIGGDEVHFGNHMWKTFPEVKEMMKKNKWKSMVDVEHYFLNRMADTIQNMNKTVLGWDEVVGAGLSRYNTTVMWWRHDKPQLFEKSIKEGYQVIMCPRLPLYFDFVQHDSHKDGRRWNGIADIESVYAFPNKEMTGGNDFDKANVLGMQANIWTEVIHNNDRMEFMTFPRIAALAEASWTTNGQKNWKGFSDRLPGLINFYQQRGIKLFNPLQPNKTPEINGPVKSN